MGQISIFRPRVFGVNIIPVMGRLEYNYRNNVKRIATSICPELLSLKNKFKGNQFHL